MTENAGVTYLGKAGVSYLGEIGSYSYQAAVRLFPEAKLSGFRSFDEVVGAVNSSECECAVIPVENTIGGRIPDVHNLLLTTDLSVCSEFMLEIRHSFVTLRSASEAPIKTSITKIFSHPQGFIQCSQFLSNSYPDAELIDTTDTAAAAKLLRDENLTNAAAITSIDAAQFYNCQVLKENISNLSNNYTRFLTLAKEPFSAEIRDDSDCITTIIFQVEHTPGSLRGALGVFEDAKINVVKLETYNLSERTIRPTFYIDVGAALTSPAMSDAMANLQQKATYIKLLGTYPSSPVRSTMSGYLPTVNSN